VADGTAAAAGRAQGGEAGAARGEDALLGAPSGEERRTLAELRRVLPALPQRVGLTVALAPVFVGHSVALTLRLDQPLAPAELRSLLRAAPGLDVHEGGAPQDVPANVDAAERDEVLVSRVRIDPGDPATVRLFLTFDNLRLAARNVLLVLEALREQELV
jgi:aspartate-semialdehyde dehydrogenase